MWDRLPRERVRRVHEVVGLGESAQEERDLRAPEHGVTCAPPADVIVRFARDRAGLVVVASLQHSLDRVVGPASQRGGQGDGIDSSNRIVA